MLQIHTLEVDRDQDRIRAQEETSEGGVHVRNSTQNGYSEIIKREKKKQKRMKPGNSILRLLHFVPLTQTK